MKTVKGEGVIIARNSIKENMDDYYVRIIIPLRPKVGDEFRASVVYKQGITRLITHYNLNSDVEIKNCLKLTIGEIINNLTN